MIDAEDKELDEMFHGEEKPLHHDTVHINLGRNNSINVGKPKKETPTPKLKPRDADWEPQPHEPTQLDKLKECAKSALLFGGLGLLIFYFQQSGQMAMSASMPCIVACAILAGFGVGKHFAGGK